MRCAAPAASDVIDGNQPLIESSVVLDDHVPPVRDRYLRF
jgi:hypothetical protein